ncbi:hypothetical protein G163CM_08040 [Pseudocitrobacter corydidari]|uniref:Uncharacterized protein n=2 Tax=Pseudocitrobacter corydidari TaxID=2891570 RepID=A0ABY3S0B1_9ENTR|nr:hypothetical protein G163CM_08040 [Pseudocitrobacter corydidari]
MRLLIKVIFVVVVSHCMNVCANDNVIRYPYRYGRVSLNDKGEIVPQIIHISDDIYGVDEVGTSINNARMAQSGVTMRLGVIQQGRVVNAVLDFYNRNNQPAYIFKGGLLPCNAAFNVSTCNIVLDGMCGIFDGVDGWQLIPPGGHYKKSFSLTQAFEFLQGKHHYKINTRSFSIRVGNDIFAREAAERILFDLINWRYGYALKSYEMVSEGDLLAGTYALSGTQPANRGDEYLIYSNQISITLDGSDLEHAQAYQWRIESGLTPKKFNVQGVHE